MSRILVPWQLTADCAYLHLSLYRIRRDDLVRAFRYATPFMRNNRYSWASTLHATDLQSGAIRTLRTSARARPSGRSSRRMGIVRCAGRNPARASGRTASTHGNGAICGDALSLLGGVVGTDRPSDHPRPSSGTGGSGGTAQAAHRTAAAGGDRTALCRSGDPRVNHHLFPSYRPLNPVCRRHRTHVE
jgi:hypothetical protein